MSIKNIGYIKNTFRIVMAVCLFVLSTGISSYASVLPYMGEPGTLMQVSAPFSNASLLGMRVYPQDPLRFSFILGQGDAFLNEQALKSVSQKMIRYFLAGLAIPEDDLWVNLSPYETDRIISPVLGETEIGHDMLGQDYVLKQLASSLTYPDNDLGKTFWKTVYQRAEEELGTRDIPVDLLNKVWIIPERSVVYEMSDRVVVKEAKLKVMLEADYLAWKSQGKDVFASEEKQSQYEEVAASPMAPRNDMSNEVMREIVVPVLEKEVNEGQHFAPLRQVYHALILASWFKDNLKESIVSEIYANQSKVAGIESQDEAVAQKIYEEYLKAYQAGAYNYIKEDVDALTQEVIPRKYFSGGLVLGVSKTREDKAVSDSDFSQHMSDAAQGAVEIQVRLKDSAQKFSSDSAQTFKFEATGARLGKARFVSLTRESFDDTHAKMMGVLMGLDHLVRVLDEAYNQKGSWSKMFSRLSPSQDAKVRKVVRELIKRMYRDFQSYKEGERGELSSYDFLKRTETLLIDILANGTVNLDEIERGELYSVVAGVIQDPFVLSDKLVVSKEMFEEDAKVQKENFEKAYEFIIEEMRQTFSAMGPRGEGIFDSYYSLLRDQKSEVLTDFNGLAAAGYAQKLVEKFEEMAPVFAGMLSRALKKFEEDPSVRNKDALKSQQAIYFTILESIENAGMVFTQVVRNRHWHTNQLREIVLSEVFDEVDNALKEAHKYSEFINKYAMGFSENSPELSELTDIVYQYVSKIEHLLGSIDDNVRPGMKGTTNSYQYLILETALSETLKAKGVFLQEKYRPLLAKIGQQIIGVAQLNLPSVHMDQGVNVALDYVPTPSQYQVIHDHFGENLKNIILTNGGSVNIHAAFLASADGVGFIVANESNFPLDVDGRLANIYYSEDDMGTVHMDFLASEDTVVENSEDVLTMENLNSLYLHEVQSKGILANADHMAGEYAKRIEGFLQGVGLVRSENQPGDVGVPSKDFYVETWGQMLKALGGKALTVRAYDFKEDKRTVLLAHVKYEGKKFYLEDPLGLEIFKEQLRAMITLRQRGLKTIRMMFPMVEDMEDIRKIKKALDEVGSEEVDGEKIYALAADDDPLELGIMAETFKAVSNIEELMSVSWIKFVSIGTNDLTSETYNVDRTTQEANQYYTHVQPSILKMIIDVAKVAHEKGKTVTICGDLASKKRFFILQNILMKMGNNIGLSMPVTQIAWFNGIEEALKDRSSKKAEALIAIEQVVRDVIDTSLDIPEEFDKKFFDRLNNLLAEEIRTAEDYLRNGILVKEGVLQSSNSLIVKALEENVGTDVDNAEVGGLDFTKYQDGAVVQKQGGGLSVSFAEGATFGIDVANFQGFSFDVLSIAPYVVVQ